MAVNTMSIDPTKFAQQWEANFKKHLRDNPDDAAAIARLRAVRETIGEKECDALMCAAFAGWLVNRDRT